VRLHLCIIKRNNNKNKQLKKTNKMKKIIIIAAALISLNTVANAQSANSSASQTVNLNLSDAIDITFTGSGTATGAAVNLAFNTVSDYANGVQSTSQQMKVRSNKNFKVSVKANSANFSYTGSTSPAPTMPVASVLSTKVSANSTGGSTGSGFGSYKAITTTNQDIITGATAGGNNLFSVQYEAQPGFAYPAGTYTVDVVYTATQL